MENIILGLQGVLQPVALLYLIGGVTGGLLIGALPGFTATMGMIVLLPVTYSLPPQIGMLLLVGVYVGGIAGGCIPAIALNIPGTPASAATTFDGYPLFRQGRGEEALGVGIVASASGGVISALLLMTLAPQLARFALEFGPAEYFALGTLGMTLIVSVSGTSVLRGLFACLIGAALATVGTDPILGIARFAFDEPHLMAGIAYVPALIGLFGFSEVIEALATKVKPQQSSILKGFGMAKIRLATIRKIGPTVIRSGLVGTFIGAIPGAGADIAAFLSYEVEKKTAKDPSVYGTGEIRGVAASEAGNNADAGGAMIPMLTFGIPGDAQTSVMIAGLMMQGIRPGPLLFTEQADLVWTIFIGLFLAQFIMMAVGLFSASIAVRAVAQPPGILFPVVAVLSIVGAFSLNNSMFDVWCMIGFGVFGYILKKLKIPAFPLVLALILVPMVESELRRALMITPTGFLSFFKRPVFDVLFGLACLSLVSAFSLQLRTTLRKSYELSAHNQD
jgi:putative tricarboxylic transport membrane protein